MAEEVLNINNIPFPLHRFHTVIAGSGAGGFAAAVRLYDLGVAPIAIITDDRQGGTSRNAGSDKQTYYKLSLQGSQPDSVGRMAENLYNGGSMHGDLALTEAALSAGCFTHLARLGVPFPTNAYGEYIGYQTDHDTSRRATSAGPLTSRYMVEALEKEAEKRNIPLLENCRIVSVLTHEKKAAGLLVFKKGEEHLPHHGLHVILACNVILATGGPAALYASSVYPASQTGATGAALLAGVEGVNLTEWQYGLASLAPRWNLSGTYQQVLPRYFSTDEKGKNKQEFLEPYFENKKELLTAVFLKGYQWPFDPAKINGSSIIDLLVYHEKVVKGRRVFLDYTRNPACCAPALAPEHLEEEPLTYLSRSGALFGTPIERLQYMNPAAVAFFSDKGVDLTCQPLEIDVCAQHCNGGLGVNRWYETSLPRLFAIGEAAGVFGVHRPGGSALNSTQVGAMRAAEYIAACYKAENAPIPDGDIIGQISGLHRWAESVFSRPYTPAGDLAHLLSTVQEKNTAHAAFVREPAAIKEDIAACKEEIALLERQGCLKNASALELAFICRDTLYAQLALLSSIDAHIQAGGGSRGSYLIAIAAGAPPSLKLPPAYRCLPENKALREKLLYVGLQGQADAISAHTRWEQCRPLPQNDDWFETAWARFRRGDYLKED